MCLFQPKVPEAAEVEPPPETQAMKQPDAGEVRSTVGRRTGDELRSGTETILTSGSGVTTAAPTEKKTLLGQ